ncbi:hypothetical protein B5X24_HaOG201629 [Helicoverpa armigera]|nr:hypothetical protein B5X24_HaOG201629 [Helicoverpa armigera]
MNNFVFIALLVFLGIVVVQGYGPKISRKSHGSSHRSSHGSKQRGSSHGGPPQRGKSHWSSQRGSSHHGSSHHGSNDHGSSNRKRPHTQPKDVGKNHQAGHWENSPVWIDDPDSYEKNRDDSGSYDSDDYDSSDYDSRGRDRGRDRDSSGPDDSGWGSNDSDYSPGSGSSEYSGPSSEEDGSFYNHFHSKVPCKRPHTKPTRGTTMKPTRRTTPHPTTPRGTPKPSNNNWGEWHPNTPTEETTHWETTTSLPETTTEGEEAITTLSPEITNCIASCASTPEYNPVCGSNGVTYDNEGKLFCANSCGVSVTLRRRSVCPPPPFDEGDSNDQTAPTTPPTTTLTAPVGRTTSLTSFQRCMRNCRITASFTPVCGTDLVTYMNMDRLKCAQSCGEVVEVLCEKPCAACGYSPVAPKTTTLAPTTSSSNIARTTVEPNVQECIDSCLTKQQQDPICGSDGVTYKNPYHLICAQMCGIEVIVRRFGPCSPTTAITTTTTTTTTTTEASVTYSPAVLKCIRGCPVTAEYNPVCGTDTLTYANHGNLECAKWCGVDYTRCQWKQRCPNYHCKEYFAVYFANYYSTINDN